MKKKQMEDSDDAEEVEAVPPPKKKKKTPPPQDEEDGFADEDVDDNESQTSQPVQYFTIPDDADILDLRGSSRSEVVPCFNRVSTNNYVSVGMCEGFNEKTKGKIFSRSIFIFQKKLLSILYKELIFFYLFF